MKDQGVLFGVIVGIALIVSAAFISSGLKSLGRGLERAGSSLQQGISNTRLSTTNPTKFEVSFSDGGTPFRIAHL